MWKFIKTTVLGGLILVLPFTVLAILLGKIYALMRVPIEPLAAHSPIKGFAGIGITTLAAVLLIFFLCFLAGLVIRTARAHRMLENADTYFLSYVPGYAIIRSLVYDISGKQADINLQGALAWIEECWQPALLVEELEDGWLVVFVPQVPTPFSGALYFMPPERVKRLEATSVAVLQCIKKFGVGSRALMKGQL
jgi:uncharacterized membrane protein